MLDVVQEEKEKEDFLFTNTRIVEWILVGPFLFFFSLTLLFTKASLNSWPFLLSALLSLFLCRKGGRKGFYFGLALLCIGNAFSFSELVEHSSLLWQIGLQASLVLSLCITHSSILEAISFYSQQEEERRGFIQKIEQQACFFEHEKDALFLEKKHLERALQEVLVKEERYKKQEISYQGLLHKEKQEKDKFSESSKKFMEEAALYRERALSLQISLEEALREADQMKYLKQKQEREKELLEDLNEVRLERFQLSLLFDFYFAKQEMQQKELQNLKESKTLAIPDKKEKQEQEFASFQNLKKQFKEKTEILDQTRKKLFQVETALIALQKESELRVKDLSSQEVHFLQHLEEMEKECKNLEFEVQHLQELLSLLLLSNKKKLTLPSKAPSSKKILQGHLELAF